MTTRAGRLVKGLALVLLGVAGAVALPPAARAATPAVAVEPGTARIGQPVRVRVTGFPPQRSVTITLCGNTARRGSIDCDLAGSQGLGISAFDQVHETTFVIGTPPAPCPCVIQVSNTTQSEVVSVPIAIEGFPTAPVQGNSLASPLTIDVRVRRAPQNALTWMRSFLGGPTPYRVEVLIHNRSAQGVHGVKLMARAGRSETDQARRVIFPEPGTIAPGKTWAQVQTVTLSAPVIGRFVWTVSARGEAAVAKQRLHTSHQPWGLYLVLLALASDLAWLAYRRTRRMGKPTDGDVSSY